MASVFLVMFLAGCSSLGNITVGVAGHVIGNILVDEIKENMKEKKEEKDGKESS